MAYAQALSISCGKGKEVMQKLFKKNAARSGRVVEFCRTVNFRLYIQPSLPVSFREIMANALPFGMRLDFFFQTPTAMVITSS
jgi:hypothetical protein